MKKCKKRINQSPAFKGTKLVTEIMAATIALMNSAYANGEQLSKPTKGNNGFGGEVILQYSKLPTEVTIKAWSDPKYGNFLLRNPNSVLREYWGRSIDLDFIVHPNTDKVKHLCLPFPTKEIQSLTPAETLTQLEYEAGRAVSLNYFLPPAVITKAFFDDDFKSGLLRNPNKVLQAMGYPVADLTCIVHENTVRKRHLALDVAPNNAQELRAIERRAVIQSCPGCHGTGQCCASGTCDN